MDKPTNPKKESQPKSVNTIIAFTGLGFQMAAIIGAMTWLGDYLDSINESETAIYTVIFSLLGIFASLYIVFKGLTKKS